MEAQTTKFEGWAVVELFGHAKEVGYVTTQYFGSACLFQIDVPELEEVEEVTDRPRWVDGQLLPIGSKVKGEAVQGRSRLIGPSAIYSLNPCDEQMARAMVRRNIQRTIKLVSLPEGQQLPAPAPDNSDEGDHDEESED